MGRGGERVGDERWPLGLSAPVLLFAAVLAVAGGTILALTWEMTFYQDTWALLLERRDLSLETVLAPHNEHIVAIPVLIEQLLVRLFGMSSARPEYILATIALLGSAALLFVYVRRRVGDWLALFAVTLVLFLGPAWEVLLWPFEISFAGSVFFGLAALLSLEHDDRRWDLAAAVFLVLALGFSSLGLPFLAGAAVAVAVCPSERRLRRLHVIAIPALLFGAWYLGWGSRAVSHLSVENALDSPRFVLEAIAANAGSTLGLNPDPTSDALGRGPNVEPGLDPIWSRLIVGALFIALVACKIRRPRFSRWVWPAAAVALTNWFLLALNYFPGREPTNSRYQYAGAIFVLMLVASLFDGARPKRAAIAVAGAVAALALVPHLVVLEKGGDFLDEQSVLTRADTVALEIARNRVDPTFQLTDEVAGTPTLPNVFAGEYFTAVDEYGSPAYTPAELEAAPADGRFQADIVLAFALPITVAVEPGAFRDAAAGCMVLPAGEKTGVALPPGTTARVEIAPGPDALLELRRFATGDYPINAARPPGGSTVELTIPADTVSRPWRLRPNAPQPVRVCR